MSVATRMSQYQTHIEPPSATFTLRSTASRMCPFAYLLFWKCSTKLKAPTKLRCDNFSTSFVHASSLLLTRCEHSGLIRKSKGSSSVITEDIIVQCERIYFDESAAIFCASRTRFELATLQKG